MLRIEDQPAYLLHLRPYRDTSALIDLLTRDYGRVSVVAKGVRKSKSAKRQLLNPFQGLLIGFQGDGDLKLLTHFESSCNYFHLLANHLYAALYLNEIIIRLLPEMDSHPRLFDLYQTSLDLLSEQHDIEPILRNFEFSLLQDLGYAIDFRSTHEGLPVMEDGYYFCDPERGVVQVNESQPNLILGCDLLAIAEKDYRNISVRRVAKILSRQLLKPLLGNRPLKSRELFTAHPIIPLSQE